MAALTPNAEAPGEEILTFLIGVKRKPFTIPRKLFTNRSVIFEAIISGIVSGPDRPILTLLPDEEEATFAAFAAWLSDYSIPFAPAVLDPRPVGPTRQLERLYIFGEKFCMTDLCNRVMDTIQDNNILCHSRPSKGQIRRIYQNTCDGSNLRLYCAALVSRDMIRSNVPGDEEKFMGRMEGNPELAMDVIRFQKVVGRRLYTHPMVEPRRRGGLKGLGKCHFHTHAEGEACYL